MSELEDSHYRTSGAPVIIDEATEEASEVKMEEWRERWRAEGWDGNGRGEILFVVVQYWETGLGEDGIPS